MPYKLPFFDDLFAEPMKIYDFTKTMAMATQDHLSPGGLAEKKDTLYKLVYFLGVDRKVAGFRSYGANLNPEVDEAAPLLRAIEGVFMATGGELTHVVFGKKADYPNPKAELEKQIGKIDIKLQRPLATLVLNVLDAYLWRQRAIRNVDPASMEKVFQIRDLSESRSEGRVYHFEIDDLARDLDEQSLYYAGMKTVQAADDARRQFAELLNHKSLKLSDVRFDFRTPIGRILLSGTGYDIHRETDAAVLVDLGGNDCYEGPVGGTPSSEIPISIAIDCVGNDTYECLSETYPSQGAGILGVGVLIDDAGNDTYRAISYAQGLGFFGLGLLFDRSGDDTYTLEMSGQGAGYFGLGYHFDVSGNDHFYLYGDGQGFGGPGGVGVLANYEGNDDYIAEPLAEKAGRPDYHSQYKITYSNAQGVGAGRRGDGADGHNWAGGLGVLLDIKGDDTYESGNWSIGTGYWYGTGLLYEGEGDDTYKSVYFTQASGAHFCIGAIIDEAGNDHHTLYETGGAGLAFGWDFADVLLIDKGGNDSYEARGNSIGRADIRSNALLIDIGGDDRYVYPAGAGGLGFGAFQEGYRKPSYSYGPYNFYANSFGLLLDIGGRDQYLDLKTDTNQTTPSKVYGDNQTWQQPAPGSENYGYKNFGIGMDLPDGTVPELYVFDERPVKK
jgi:hypothetical protein